MKKFLTTTALSVLALTTLSACGNKDLLGTHYTFKHAQVKMLDGSTVDKEVKQWYHESDNDNVRVTFVDGTEYYGNSNNIMLYN